MKKVRWPGRFQVISRKPLTIVDGAHNPAGIRVLRETLRSKFPGKKFAFVVGVQEDKDAKTMLKELQPLAKEIIVTRSVHRQAAKSVAGRKTKEFARALELTAGKDRIITGSLYLAADALKTLDAGSRA